MNDHKLRALGFAAAALVCACTSTPGPQNTYTFREGAPLEEVQGNRDLANLLKIERIQSARLDDGRLRAQFDLHSQATHQLDLDWTVEWFDASGMRVDVPHAWRPLALGAKGVQTVQIIGPTSAAGSWRLAVRPRTSIR